MSAAAELAERVRRRGRIFLRVTQLLHAYGETALTPETRTSVAAQLVAAGIVADPPLAHVPSHGIVRLQAVDHAPEGDAWDETTLGTVRWIDVDATIGDAGTLAPRLAEVVGHPLTATQVDGLLRPNEHPHVEHHDGAWKISTVQLFADEPGDGALSPIGGLRVQSLELVVGPTWLLSCWHHPLTGERVERPDNLGASFAGDDARALAALLLDRLACGYGPAIATVDAWLEQWESAPDRDRGALPEVRDFVGRLSRQLEPLEDVFAELGSEWPPDTHLDHAARRTSGAVRAVHRLARRLASALALLATHDAAAHREQAARDAEAQRRQTQRLEDRVTVAGAVLLLPTLVAALFGVNVHFPGENTWWGLALLILLMLGGACASLYYFLLRTRPSQGPSDSPASPISGSASSQP